MKYELPRPLAETGTHALATFPFVPSWAISRKLFVEEFVVGAISKANPRLSIPFVPTIQAT